MLTYNCVDKDEQLEQVIVVSSSSQQQQQEEEEEENNMDEEKKESKTFVSQSGRDWYSSWVFKKYTRILICNWN